MFTCDKCGATFEDGIDAGHHEADHEADAAQDDDRCTALTSTATRSAA